MSITKNAWPAAVVGLGGVAILGGLYVLKVDQTFLEWAGMLLLVPLMTALIMGGQADTKAAVAQVQQATQAVHTTVNGNTSKMLDMIDRYAQAMLTATPPAPAQPASVPPAPDITSGPAPAAPPGVPPQ